ncbi:hypothetical protein [Dictyobacter formicarum]|uniref:Ig-like domain-containing protein n=1 Tax=Dictyobacter formicarum TaxID=2778368 RepID=A0ABQ3VJJ4_9CHLR|nr:hypothetical protein [Dictyobacter formicarum]GHO86342.1 hypothetical protein KSZ_43480 [Dictyobacter formicarum]
MLRSVQNNTVLLAGWLFADLLLGLMVIFMAAIPGVPPPTPPAPPRLIVSPKTVVPRNPDCAIGNVDKPRCEAVVTLKESDDSKVNVTWSVHSDISDSIGFSPDGGTLTPGQEVQIKLSKVPCQNGSFTFDGTASAASQTVAWQCKAKPDRLESNYVPLRFTGEDTDGILNNNRDAINRLKRDIKARPELHNRRVGLVIIEGGDPNDTGHGIAVAEKVYTILDQLSSEGFAPFADASHYKPLFALQENTDVILIDVYLFKITQ